MLTEFPACQECSIKPINPCTTSIRPIPYDKINYRHGSHFRTLEDDLVPIGIWSGLESEKVPTKERGGLAYASYFISTTAKGDMGNDADHSCGWKRNFSKRVRLRGGLFVI